MKKLWIVKKKLRQNRGLSLLEMLITTLIFALVTSMLVTGMVTGVQAYNKTVDAANAQEVLSNTVTFLRYELGTAMNVTVVDDTTLSYHSSRGWDGKIYIAPADKEKPTSLDTIYLEEYGTSRKLIESVFSNEAGMLTVVYESIECVDRVITVTNLCVYKEGYEVPLAKLEELIIYSY